MKKINFGIFLMIICVFLTGCSCEHIWQEATCTKAKTCQKCEATEGEPNGHSWEEATCVTAKTCSVCGETEGEALGHDWTEATCLSAKMCSVCGTTEGKKLGHNYKEKFCSHCGQRDPFAFVPEDYSFYDMQGKNKWIEIASYDFKNGYVKYERTMHTGQLVYEFDDGLVSNYTVRVGYGEFKKNPIISTYQIINRDSVKMDAAGIVWTIKERVTHGDWLVLKVNIGGSEHWFVLEDQLDMENREISRDPEDPTCEIRKYKFK